MLTVDAQVHIWRDHVPTNPNHRQIPNFTADDLLQEMDAAGVDAAIIHPPGWDPNSNALDHRSIANQSREAIKVTAVSQVAIHVGRRDKRLDHHPCL